LNRSHHFEIIRIFLSAAVDEEPAAQKPKKKIQISATHPQFFAYISKTAIYSQFSGDILTLYDGYPSSNTLA
jgi:hypothetical protein